jgi:replicative DNA helicase
MNTEKNIKKQPTNADMSIFTFGKVPPQARDLEQAVLGAIMLESHLPDSLMNDFKEDLFYVEQNILICRAIRSLYSKNYPIDILTVTQKLKEEGNLDICGGAYYITELTNRVATAANVEYHLRILQQQSLKRKVISVCTNGVKKAYDESEDIFDTYQHIQVQLDLSLKELMQYDVKSVSAVHEELIKESIRVAKSGVKSGVPCGLRMVDNVTNGWQKSDLIILAGRPSMGKTAAAVSMVIYPTVYHNTPVAIFSLEMSNEQLVSRMQSFISEVNVSKIVKKQLTMYEIEQIKSTCYPLETAPIFVDDTPNISLLELKGKARKLVKENGVQLIVIDYLQLMRSGLNIQNREQEIAEISRGLKGLAKELSIPIIALSQLSRGVESRSDKKPMLSDLRESGQIEQDADMVMFCYRPEYYGIDNYEIGGEIFDSKGLFMLIIAKHRNGELGEVPLTFVHAQTKLANHGYGQEDNSYKNIEPKEDNVIDNYGKKPIQPIQNNDKGWEEEPPF